MIRYRIALAAASMTLACTTALADPPNVRRYTPSDLFMGSGDPKTPLVYGENPISGSSFQINCTHPSCEVAVNFRNSYCSYIIYGSFFGSRVYVDGNRLVLANWVTPDYDAGGHNTGHRCTSGVWVGNFELHSGSHTVMLDTYINWDTTKYPTTQGLWQANYQVGIPNP